jgi:hypothetical protein
VVPVPIKSRCMPTINCSQCGLLLSSEGSPPPAEGSPCPQCGSTRRNYILLTGTAELRIVAAPATLLVIDYPRALLGEAEDLINRGKYGIAIVVAHIACEVAVQRALSAAFAKRVNR